MKKTLLIFSLLLLFCLNCFAYTAQTKGLILEKRIWRNGVVAYSVLIDEELVTIKSDIDLKSGDTVLITVEINGPEKPKVWIMTKILRDRPPGR